MVRRPRWRPTDRQHEVLALAIMRGRKEAAFELGLAEVTVESTIAAMRRHASVRTTEQLVYVGAREGWLRLPILDRA